MNELPPDLQNIVCLFAYNTTLGCVKRSLALYLVIRSMHLPFFFYKRRIWCWHERKFIKNPMTEFVPIETVGGKISELFDDDGFYCFLLALDFRRKKVRMFGSREKWLHRLSCGAVCRVLPDAPPRGRALYEKACTIVTFPAPLQAASRYVVRCSAERGFALAAQPVDGSRAHDEPRERRGNPDRLVGPCRASDRAAPA